MIVAVTALAMNEKRQVSPAVSTFNAKKHARQIQSNATAAKLILGNSQITQAEIEVVIAVQQNIISKGLSSCGTKFGIVENPKPSASSKDR